MRCLALAKTMISVGEKVCFLIADENPVSVLAEAGLDYIILYSNWQDLLTDVEQVKSILQKEHVVIQLIKL